MYIGIYIILLLYLTYVRLPTLLLKQKLRKFKNIKIRKTDLQNIDGGPLPIGFGGGGGGY